MVKDNKNDKEMLERILTSEGLETLTKAYKMLKVTKNAEFNEALLRRIDDVISMVRYIELSYPMFHHEDYDALSARMINLEIAMVSITNPESQERSFNYFADNNSNPIILHSIEQIDIHRFPIIGDLLHGIANGKAQTVSVTENLKVAKKESENILYFDKDNQIIIYDLISGIKPKISIRELKEIQERCRKTQEEGLDPTIQKIYDEMVYQTLNFNFPEKGNGYALTKKRDEKR